MMVDINRCGKYCYVEGDDSYIFYYLFNYRLNKNKCYFKDKYLERVLKILNKKQINCKLKTSGNIYIYIHIYIYNDINYNKYLDLGRKKYEFDRYLLGIEKRLNDVIDSKNFNKIYRKIMNKIYE